MRTTIWIKHSLSILATFTDYNSALGQHVIRIKNAFIYRLSQMQFVHFDLYDKSMDAILALCINNQRYKSVLSLFSLIHVYSSD